MKLLTMFSAMLMVGGFSAALAGPPANNPGQPFAAIIAKLEAIQAQLDEASAEILNAIGEISTDLAGIGTQIAAVQTDINDVKSDLSLVKSDLSTIKTDTSDIKTGVQTLQGSLEDAQPLTQFKNLVRSVSEFGGDTKRLTQDIESTGPMLVEVCKRSGIGDGQDDGEGEGIVRLFTLPQGTRFQMLEEGVPECRTIGINTGETLRVRLIADAGVVDIARVTVDIAIRTTPFAVISIPDSVIESL